MSERLYDTIHAGIDAEDDAEQPTPAHEKHGKELVSHVFFYGITQHEADNFDREQVAMLTVMGLI